MHVHAVETRDRPAGGCAIPRGETKRRERSAPPPPLLVQIEKEKRREIVRGIGFGISRGERRLRIGIGRRLSGYLVPELARLAK